MITKSKIRKYLHLAGLLIAGAAGAAIWLARLNLPVSAKLGASFVLVTTLLTSLNAAMPNLLGFVESLPIPETETTTTTTTTTTTSAAQPSSVLDITAIHSGIPQQSPDPTPVTIPIRPPTDKGAINGWLLAVLAGIGLGLCITFAWTSRAHAADFTPQLGTCLDAANTWCVQPATAAGWQINLKTGDLRNAAVLVGYSVVHNAGFALGAGIYAGAGLSSDGPNAPQANLLISLANFGAVGAGVQRVKYPDGVVAWQGLLGVFGNLNFGGTPRYVLSAARAGR